MNVHFETFDEKSFALIERLVNKGPIAISISPWQIPKIKDYQIAKLKEIFSREEYILGQQGLNHKCNVCAAFHAKVEGKEIVQAGIDPWHENYCLWYGQIPEKEQITFMKKGRELLEKTFDKTPELYVPPNHLFDLITLGTAAKMKYKWITDRALIPLQPYKKGNIIIISEGEPEINCNQVYIHADRWRGDLEKEIEKEFESFSQIKPQKADERRLKENKMLKIVGKLSRDLHKGFGMSEENAKKAASLIYQTKFADTLAI